MKKTIILAGVLIVTYTAAVFSIGRFYGTRHCLRLVQDRFASQELDFGKAEDEIVLSGLGIAIEGVCDYPSYYSIGYERGRQAGKVDGVCMLADVLEESGHIIFKDPNTRGRLRELLQ